MKPLPLVALLGLTVSIGACERVKPRPVENLSGGRIYVMGHAGAGFESALNPFPPNAITSIRKTLEGFNAHGTEMDVQLTQDSALVLYHDGTLESLTECRGYIYSLPAAAVTGCRYRTDFNSHILQEERVQRLANVLARYAGSPLAPRFDFDLKLPEEPGVDLRFVYPKFARRLATAVAPYPELLPRVNFMSTNVSQLLAIRQAIPGARVVLDDADFEQGLAAANTHNLTGIVLSNDNATADQVRRAHAAGREVTLYKVRLRPEIISAVDKDPDAIQSDNILLLQQILAARYGQD
ncbi:MAG: hypothetical protein H7330_09440 [Hymenobacteraceae bacterium]|nr:hypothetical protein [Hymenobacteraceae bacterium]